MYKSNNIESIKNFKGGEEDNIPVNKESIEHMQYIIDTCTKLNIQQPELYPWVGGDGVQAEWQLKNGWYIEINSSSRGIEGLCVKEGESKRYDKTIECKFSNIDSAVNFLEIMIQSDNLQTKISNTQKDLETSKE